MDLAKLHTEHNKEQSRFELKMDNDLAFIDYKVGKSGNWYLIHTEVPDHLEGQGAGNKLVRESLEIIEKLDVKIIPTCPFVRTFIKRHRTDYENILAEGVNL